MLNKDICYKCFMKNRENARGVYLSGGYAFYYQWDVDGNCLCLFSETLDGKPVFVAAYSINEPPPEKCPYLLEQLLNEKTVTCA